MKPSAFSPRCRGRSTFLGLWTTRCSCFPVTPQTRTHQDHRNRFGWKKTFKIIESHHERMGEAAPAPAALPGPYTSRISPKPPEFGPQPHVETQQQNKTRLKRALSAPLAYLHCSARLSPPSPGNLSHGCSTLPHHGTALEAGGGGAGVGVRFSNGCFYLIREGLSGKTSRKGKQ